MDNNEVKPGHAQISGANGLSEGLRILARMIARQLVARKSGVDAHRPSDYGRPPMPNAPRRKGTDNGGN